MLRLIVRSIVAPDDWSYHRSSGATIDRTIGHRMPRVLVRSIAWCNDRLVVPSVAGCHGWSYIGRWSLPLVAWFPTMALAIDILHPIVRSRNRTIRCDCGLKDQHAVVLNRRAIHIHECVWLLMIGRWYWPKRHFDLLRWRCCLCLDNNNR